MQDDKILDVFLNYQRLGEEVEVLLWREAGVEVGIFCSAQELRDFMVSQREGQCPVKNLVHLTVASNLSPHCHDDRGKVFYFLRHRAAKDEAEVKQLECFPA